MKEHIHYTPGYSSYEEVEAAFGPFYDATTLSKISDCPRYYEVRVEENLEPQHRMNAKMAAGIALHFGLEFYYSYPSAGRTDVGIRMAVEMAKQTWRDCEIDEANMDASEAHLNEDAIAGVLRNYFHYWGNEAIEIYQPITGLKVSDLDLTRVIAARIRLNHADEVILGESNIIMQFDVDGRRLVLAGKPDLPVQTQDGRIFAMDHKTTSSYLSDYWAKTHEMSNKDRGYMAMLEGLLHREVSGSVINGIYVGRYANNPDSKAVKFTRYPFDFSQDHILEALRNQLAWSDTITFYRERGYFPQGCGYGGCKMPSICRRDPPTRDVVKMNDWQQSTRKFWDL